jgi:hypothetical protein
MNGSNNSNDSIKNIVPLAAPPCMTQNPDSDNLRETLDQICSQIAQRFNLYSIDGRTRKSTIVDVIARFTCLSCINERLSDQNVSNDVDALYKECHRLAVNALVEELYFLLNQTGYKVLISTEEKLDYGKADILITVTNYGLNLKGKTKELLIEVKTGNSLSLSQLFRYLLNSRSDTIIVWRVRKRQVLTFNAQIIEPLLTEFTKMICLRGIRLLLSPQLQSCKHTKQSNYLPTQEELQEMFQDFSEAVIETLPHVVERILRELDVASSKDGGRNHAKQEGVQ